MKKKTLLFLFASLLFLNIKAYAGAGAIITGIGDGLSEAVKNGQKYRANELDMEIKEQQLQLLRQQNEAAERQRKDKAEHLNAKAGAMTLEQALELPGMPILYDRITNVAYKNYAEAIVENYGLPTLIVDFGVERSRPKKMFKLGKDKINLTLDDWNLVYATDVPKNAAIADRRFWLNPEPIMPGQFYNFRSVIFNIESTLKPDEQNGQFRESNLGNKDLQTFLGESRDLTGITAFFERPVSLDKITARFGNDYEITTDKDMQEVYRYKIVIPQTNDPLNVKDYMNEALGMKLFVDIVMDSALQNAIGFCAYVGQDRPTTK